MKKSNLKHLKEYSREELCFLAENLDSITERSGIRSAVMKFLLQYPDPQVRLALLSAEDISSECLEALLEDEEPAISVAAQHRLDNEDDEIIIIDEYDDDEEEYVEV